MTEMMPVVFQAFIRGIDGQSYKFSCTGTAFREDVVKDSRVIYKPIRKLNCCDLNITEMHFNVMDIVGINIATGALIVKVEFRHFVLSGPNFLPRTESALLDSEIQLHDIMNDFWTGTN